MKYKSFNLTTAMILAFSCLLSVPSYAAKVVEEGNTRSVNHATWQKRIDVKPQELVNRANSNGVISLFFIRPISTNTDIEQSSINIAVNDRYQVSLHPGNYSQVYSCEGINQISAVSTAQKTNDLLKNAQAFNLQNNESNNYYFYIDRDGQDQIRLRQITEDSASKILPNRRYQAHQISRIVPKCL